MRVEKFALMLNVGRETSRCRTVLIVATLSYIVVPSKRRVCLCESADISLHIGAAVSASARTGDRARHFCRTSGTYLLEQDGRAFDRNDPPLGRSC